MEVEGRITGTFRGGDDDGKILGPTSGQDRVDGSFFDGLNRIVQSEPWLDRDRVMIDQLKSLGIEKGKPFAPTATAKPALATGMDSCYRLRRMCSLP